MTVFASCYRFVASLLRPPLHAACDSRAWPLHLLDRCFTNSGLPEQETLQGLDWSYNPKLLRRASLELASLAFIPGETNTRAWKLTKLHATFLLRPYSWTRNWPPRQNDLSKPMPVCLGDSRRTVGQICKCSGHDPVEPGQALANLSKRAA